MHRTIEDVIENVRNATKGCILLIGAGCSVKAGVPTAAELVEIIRERFPRAYQRAKTPTYLDCMGELSVGQRRELIAGLVDGAKINWAHICIAQLMQAGFVDRVLTTNFDLLVVRACALVGLFPPVYDLAVSELADPGAIPERAILALHGQYTGTVLMNGDIPHARLLRLTAILEEAARDRVCLVVGYGGQNDPVFDCLAKVPRFEHGLYWIGFRDQEPPTHASERLLHEEKLAYFVDGFDADDFFVSLAQKLDCFPPDFVRAPFSYLDHLLAAVTKYTIPAQGAEVDVAADTRRLIQGYIARHERSSGAPASAGARNGNAPDVFTARYHLMAGDYDKVASAVGKNRGAVPPELAETASWAYVMQGNALLSEALGLAEGEADRVFAAAGEKYAAALELKPNKSEALHSWARALVEQAGRKSGDNANWLYSLAGEKYRALVKAKPDSSDGLFEWGSALLQQATRNGSQTAEALLTQAGEKFQATLVLKPDNHQALLKWGQTMVALAQRRGTDEAERLLAEAADKYRGALRIQATWEGHHRLANVLVAQARRRAPGKEVERLMVAAADQYQRAQRLAPDRSEIVRDWAEALVEQALRTRGEGADKFIAAAGERYEAFLALVPNDPAARLRWAQILFELGKRRPGEAGQRLLQSAADQFAHALTIKSDFREAVYGWGNVLLELATRATGAEADALYDAAIEKYRATLELKPDMYEAICSLGNALFEQAKRRQGEGAQELLTAATGQYERALGLKPDLPEALYNWGNALVEQAMRKARDEDELRRARAHFLLIRTTKETDQLFTLAGERYQAAIQVKPDMHEALNNWGTVLLEQAKRKEADEADRLFTAAKDKLMRAEAIAPGSGAYNLACVSALKGDESECQTWLEKGDTTGTLPPRTHLANDPDLDRVREAGWFRDFLAKEKC